MIKVRNGPQLSASMPCFASLVLPESPLSIHAKGKRHRWMPFFLGAVLVAGVLFQAAADSRGNEASGASDAEVRVSIPFVTNRQLKHAGTEKEAYTGGRGSPGVGRCEVIFDPIPVIDQIAPRVPFHLAGEMRRMELQRQTEAQAFWAGLSTQVGKTRSGSVVLFVHGYNYDFERHCLASAELQRSLRDGALVLMFSWPSNGRPSDYIPDQADVEWSVVFLAETMRRLGDHLGSTRVQVLAHSLGSRGVLFALERLGRERGRRPTIGPLVFIAPDFDAQTFRERLPEIVPLTGGITLYASSNDTPLKVSRRLHKSPRLGEAGAFLTVAAGMQTVDVSSLGRYQVLGHEYFLFHPTVASDLALLLGDGLQASERPGLRSASLDGLVYWELVGETPAQRASEISGQSNR